MNKLTKRLPDFLVIGAGKSGTTSLNHYLSQHPEIFMARKEPSYFAIKNLESINDPNDAEMMSYYPNGVMDFDNYQALFSDAQDGQLLGEVSPIYLNSPEAAEEIKNTIPEVKLVAILRHPAERLYSRYLHLASENRAPDMELLFDKSSAWHLRNDLVKEGFYGKNLNTYFNLFDQSQLKVILYEDYRENPLEVISSMYKFIGVDESFSPDVTIKHNQSGFAKNKVFDNLIGRKGSMNSFVKKISPSFYKKLKSNTKVHKFLLNLRNYNTVKPKQSIEEKRKITQEIYLNDIKILESLLNRDLKHWYNF